MSGRERTVLAVFCGIVLLWVTSQWHTQLIGFSFDVTLVAFLGLAVLLATDAMTWSDALAEKNAWDVFVWYGGLMTMGEILNRTGSTAALAGYVGGWFTGINWFPVLMMTIVLYFYAHYAFASITAHMLSMFPPFVVMLIGSGDTADPRGLLARVHGEPHGRPHALRHDDGPDRIRRGLRLPARLVARRLRDVGGEHRDLDGRRLRVVESGGLLVAAIETRTQRELEDAEAQRLRRMRDSMYFSSDLLKGRAALVTGGGTGICRGIALALADAGCDVAIASRKIEHLEPTAGEIRQHGVRAVAVAGDVRIPADVDGMVSRTVDAFGRLDILVNGAAGNFICLADKLSPNGFGTVVDIDLKGTFNVSRAAHPHLKKQGGAILNISATLQLLGTVGQSHAAAAKAGIDSLTRTLAVEWGPHGIRVNGLAPGPVEGTEGVARLTTPASRKMIEEHCPLGRMASIDEVATRPCSSVPTRRRSSPASPS